MKKWNWPLSFLALVNLVSLILIWRYIDGLGQGMAIMGVFIFPLYILFFSALVIFFSFLRKKTWFAKEKRWSSIILLFLCTPIPYILAWQWSQPSIITSEEVSSSIDSDFSYKKETDRSKGEILATRYWIRTGTGDYLKDSTWVIYDDKGDTVKIQLFKQGVLILEKE